MTDKNEAASRIHAQCMERGAKRIALYPYGVTGKRIEKELNDKYGVMPELILDNSPFYEGKDARIHKLDYLKKIDISPYTFIITSGNEDIYIEIRNAIAEYVPMQQICDLYSQSMYFDNAHYYEPWWETYACWNEPIRRNMLVCAANEIYANKVEGAIAELGVYKGDFAKYIGALFPDRKFYLFDTFSGFDDRDIAEQEQKDSIEFRREGANFAKNNEKFALGVIPYQNRVVVRKGWFPETSKGLEKEQSAFVSIDPDLYHPIKAGLEYFWPRMSPGGYIFVHDFVHPQLLGARRATIEYCKEHHASYFNLSDGSAGLQKPL